MAHKFKTETYTKCRPMRRNPVIADMFTQLDYMEKRGSGLRKMRELTEKPPNFSLARAKSHNIKRKQFLSIPHSIHLNWGENGRIPIEEVANRVNSSFEKYSYR